MAQFAYIGDQEGTRVFGLVFPHGQHVEVTDESAVRKLAGNPDFSQVIDGVEVMPEAVPVLDQPKRRGRPPKAR